MTNTEQELLSALKLARKHLGLSFVDLPGENFRDVRGVIDEAIESAEAVRRQAIREHRKEEAESNNI